MILYIHPGEVYHPMYKLSGVDVPLFYKMILILSFWGLASLLRGITFSKFGLKSKLLDSKYNFSLLLKTLVKSSPRQLSV